MDAINYKNGSKNQWRREMWNRLAEAIPDRRNAVVLYLPGSTDLDRPEALRRGFQPANLIAVERNPDVVRTLRQRGVVVIPGDLTEVLASWPMERPLAAVIADFQCGVTEAVTSFLNVFASHPACMFNACLVINLQRGRDPLGAHLLDSPHARLVMGISFLVDQAAKDRAAIASRASSDRSRNHVVASLLVRLYWDEIARWQSLEREATRLGRMLERAIAEKRTPFPEDIRSEFRAVWTRVERYRDYFRIVPLPAYRSSSTAPVFDSLLLRIGDCPDPIERTELPDDLCRSRRGHVAAALAIRTRKLRGELHA